MMLDLFFWVVFCRHWNEIRQELQCSVEHTSPEFTLEKMVSLGLDQHADKISEICGAACKELSIEQVLPRSLVIFLSVFTLFLSLSLSLSLSLFRSLYYFSLSLILLSTCLSFWLAISLLLYHCFLALWIQLIKVELIGIEINVHHAKANENINDFIYLTFHLECYKLKKIYIK